MNKMGYYVLREGETFVIETRKTVMKVKCELGSAKSYIRSREEQDNRESDE